MTLLGELSDAIAIVTVAQRSLEAREIANVADETVALRYEGLRPLAPTGGLQRSRSRFQEYATDVPRRAMTRIRPNSATAFDSKEKRACP